MCIYFKCQPHILMHSCQLFSFLQSCPSIDTVYRLQQTTNNKQQKRKNIHTVSQHIGVAVIRIVNTVCKFCYDWSAERQWGHEQPVAQHAVMQMWVYCDWSGHADCFFCCCFFFFFIEAQVDCKCDIR